MFTTFKFSSIPLEFKGLIIAIVLTHLAGGILLKIQKHFEIMWNIFEIVDPWFVYVSKISLIVQSHQRRASLVLFLAFQNFFEKNIV